MFALALDNHWQTDLPSSNKDRSLPHFKCIKTRKKSRSFGKLQVSRIKQHSSQPSAVGGCITELRARSSGGNEPEGWQLPGRAVLLTALLGNTQQKDHHVKHDDFTFLLVPSLQIISFMCKLCSRVPNLLDFYRWEPQQYLPEQRQPPNALPGTDDSTTAATFSAHGLNLSKILPAPPPTTPRGALPAQHLPEPRVLGAPYRRPPPWAARPPRSLSAAAQPASAARRLPRPHRQPGDGPPRPKGLRHPRTTRAPGQAMRRPPRSPLLPRPHHHRRTPPHLSGAERPCRSTQHRGGSGSCPPCLPPAAAAAAPAATPSPAGSGARGWRKGRGGRRRAVRPRSPFWLYRVGVLCGRS